MKLSIVSTLYRSAATIDDFCRRALVAAEAITADIELVLVNDGSPDDSLERALAIHRLDARVVVVDLSRNFGHHKAMMTGLGYATGDLVFLIDSDLEEEPELLQVFYERFAHGDCDVVYGVQESRKGGWFERASGALFFSIVNLLSDHPLPRNLSTVRLMTRDYVNALISHRDREFLIAHLWAITGFRQSALQMRKLSHSPSTYSLSRRVAMAFYYVTISSARLLHLITYIGLSISGLAMCAIIYVIARYFVFGFGVSGWTSLIVGMLFFGGLNTLILGILGTYMANILSETKRRPYTIVRQVHGAQAGAIKEGVADSTDGRR